MAPDEQEVDARFSYMLDPRFPPELVIMVLEAACPVPDAAGAHTGFSPARSLTEYLESLEESLAMLETLQAVAMNNKMFAGYYDSLLPRQLKAIELNMESIVERYDTQYHARYAADDEGDDGYWLSTQKIVIGKSTLQLYREELQKLYECEYDEKFKQSVPMDVSPQTWDRIRLGSLLYLLNTNRGAARQSIKSCYYEFTMIAETTVFLDHPSYCAEYVACTPYCFAIIHTNLGTVASRGPG